MITNGTMINLIDSGDTDPNPVTIRLVNAMVEYKLRLLVEVSDRLRLPLARAISEIALQVCQIISQSRPIPRMVETKNGSMWSI